MKGVSVPNMMRLPKNRPPTHPGTHLRRAILQSDLAHGEVADAMGICCQHLSAIMEGQQSITYPIAVRLEKLLGVSEGFWLRSQHAWDRWHRA